MQPYARNIETNTSKLARRSGLTSCRHAVSRQIFFFFFGLPEITPHSL